MITDVLALLSILLQCTADPTQTSIKYDKNADYVPDSSTFIRIGGSHLTKVFECPDGYVYDQIDIFKHSYTESSDLYLYKVSAQFTPGVVAKRNDIKQSSGNSFNDAYLKSGYIHVAAYQYKELEYGGEIAYKAISPISSLPTTTFTSSFGASVSASFGKTTGIMIDDMGKVGITLGDSRGISLTLTYQESTSTVTDDPALSSQYAYNDVTKKTEAQWDFSVLNGEIAGNKTYWLTTYLLFEMNNQVSYFNRDVFQTYIHYSFTGQTYFSFFGNKHWNEGKTYTGVNGRSYFK